VERTASWLNRLRKLLVRWEKKAEGYLALVQLACCIIVYRRTALGKILIEETQREVMTSVEETRKVVDRYLHSHDLSAIADDCVFVVAATGQEAKGKKAIDELLDYFYNKAFTAKYEIKDLVVGEGRAVLEADFIGKQNLEFAGIQPSGREVHVPLCVVYDVHNGKITRANIYFESDAIRIQNSR
jgi:steroid delta-isomerase-like uncharacterized protein